MTELKISSKKIRRRYILALIVVAILVTISELTISRAINLQENDANVINKAGAQRMLSQKIAYFAHTYDISIPAQQRLIVDKFQSAVNTFENNHEFLTQLPDLSEQLRKQYFEGSPPLNDEVAQYIVAAQRFIESPSQTNANYFNLIRTENILRRLNDTVSLFETEAKQQVLLVSQLKTVVWIITLVVLCIEALFIFYPMERLIVRSVNSLKEAADKAQKLQHKAEEANVAKSEFLASISHELRTPMNGMFGMMELALNDKANYKSYLKKAQLSGEQLLNLINDILDLSKIEANKLTIEHRSFNLIDMLDSVLSTYSTACVKKNVQFSFHRTDDLPKVISTDPTRLGQIINNLVNNAVKFTEQGSVKVHFSYSLIEDQPQLQISVTDTGIGMTGNQIDKVFDKFTQADQTTTRKYGGTGLGMAITKQLVELLNGTIKVESKIGEGTKFSVVIPIKVVKQEVALNAITTTMQFSCAIIDDLETSRELLDSLTKRAGFGTSLFSNVDEFLMCKREFDLVITDIAMPNKDGNDLLRGLMFNKQIPSHLIIVSAAIEKLEETVIDRIKPHTKLYKVEKPINKVAFNLILQEVRQYLSGESDKLSELDVLVVEDNLVNMEISKTMLEKTGIRVTPAYNGKEAVSLCSEKNFDVILMDMNMPVMDGITATSKIRQELKVNTPIIALTANAYDEDKKACFDVGMNDFLTKPLKEFDLVLMIKKYVQQSPNLFIK
ncbi:MAG: response regulator [Gammaproteobacteria bacterium]|nr:response regulator [Gammaproteobacteria bacterium]